MLISDVAPTTEAPSGWRTRGSHAGAFGLAAVTVLGLATLACLLFAIRQPVGFFMFVGFLVALICGVVTLVVLVLAVGYFSLRYRFERDALLLRWLWQESVVPFGAIDGIYSGARLGQAMRVRGLNWPGYHVGVGRSRTMGLVRYYTTTNDLSGVVLIATAAETYAISPGDTAAFRRELIQRVEASEAVTEDSLVATQRPTSAVRDLWLAGLTASAVALLLVTMVYIWARWDGLPELITIHVSADGTPDQQGPREDVLRVPTIGAAILIANLGVGLALYGREHVAARMMWATAVVVQVVVLIGTARILH